MLSSPNSWTERRQAGSELFLSRSRRLLLVFFIAGGPWLECLRWFSWVPSPKEDREKSARSAERKSEREGRKGVKEKSFCCFSREGDFRAADGWFFSEAPGERKELSSSALRTSQRSRSSRFECSSFFCFSSGLFCFASSNSACARPGLVSSLAFSPCGWYGQNHGRALPPFAFFLVLTESTRQSWRLVSMKGEGSLSLTKVAGWKENRLVSLLVLGELFLLPLRSMTRTEGQEGVSQTTVGWRLEMGTP